MLGRLEGSARWGRGQKGVKVPRDLIRRQGSCDTLLTDCQYSSPCELNHDVHSIIDPGQQPLRGQ
jgi:hypothetical protein